MLHFEQMRSAWAVQAVDCHKPSPQSDLLHAWHLVSAIAVQAVLTNWSLLHSAQFSHFLSVSGVHSDSTTRPSGHCMQGEHSRSATDVGAAVSKATPTAQVGETASQTRSEFADAAAISNSVSWLHSVTLVQIRSEVLVGGDDS